MKKGKSYTLDEKVIEKIEKEAKKRKRSSSFIVNEIISEKLKIK